MQELKQLKQIRANEKRNNNILEVVFLTKLILNLEIELCEKQNQHQ